MSEITPQEGGGIEQPIPEPEAQPEPEQLPVDEDELSEQPAHDPAAIGKRIQEMAERGEREAELPPGEAPPLQRDPYTETCPTCRGHGGTLTGSLVDAQEMRQCVDCGGRGWRDKLDIRPQLPAETSPEGEAATGTAGSGFTWTP